MSESQSASRRGQCPTCGDGGGPTDEESRQYLPFCSRRCQLIDLGKWLNEEYVISTPLTDEPGDVPEAEASSGAARGAE